MSRRLAYVIQRSVSVLQGQSLFTLPAAALRYSAVLYNANEVQSFRSIATTSAPRMSASLAHVLKEEIEHEAKEYYKPDIVAKGPPAPFTLKEFPGDALLTLTRDFNGEKVSIDLQILDQPEPEDFVHDDSQAALAINSVAFNVSVSKGGQQLVFECESDGSDMVITHVSHEPASAPAGDTNFSGPVYDELDENLQREFRSFLTARGIDAELGEYLRHLVHDKEQREYSGWLQRVHDFISQK